MAVHLQSLPAVGVERHAAVNVLVEVEGKAFLAGSGQHLVKLYDVVFKTRRLCLVELLGLAYFTEQECVVAGQLLLKLHEVSG